ncbi:MAG: flavodoxin family protein [Candidatus Bathyarchaeia archaeon]
MSKVKVLGVSGSPRKGRNTERLLRAALDAAADLDAETEIISLADFRILPCDGCNVCIRERRCPLDAGDDMGNLKEKLTEADAVILAAPSYFGGAPGIMKNMMDRTRPLKMDGHRLSGKVVSALSLSGLRHGGAEQVAESMVRFGLAHGMIVVGGCGDPLTTGHFGIATLQGDEGWLKAEGDAIAVTNARGVGRRVAEVALALR